MPCWINWGKIACFFGFHDWEPSPRAKTDEEIGVMMAEATDGFQILGLAMAGYYLIGLKECHRCHRERVIR